MKGSKVLSQVRYACPASYARVVLIQMASWSGRVLTACRAGGVRGQAGSKSSVVRRRCVVWPLHSPGRQGAAWNAFAHAQCVVELLAGPPQPSPTATLDPTPAHQLPTFQITPPPIHPPGCALQGSRGHRAVQDRECGAAEQAEELAGTPHHRGVYWRWVRWVGCCECCVGWVGLLMDRRARVCGWMGWVGGSCSLATAPPMCAWGGWERGQLSRRHSMLGIADLCCMPHFTRCAVHHRALRPRYMPGPASALD